MGVNSTRMIVCNMWQREAVNRMEEVMKIKKFVKCVLVPIISALFLTALFRPLCVKGGEYDYLKLWFFFGIPFGIHRMYLWIIPKEHDISGSMGVLFINLFVGSVIGIFVISWRLAVASVYLVKIVITAFLGMTRKMAGMHYGALGNIRL